MTIYKSLISLSLLLTILTVILSAWIRLAEVGIGCEDWPGCYAILGGDAEQQGITVLTEAGREMSHRGARLAHRYIASTLGLMVVFIFGTALRQGSSRQTTLLVPTAILAITLFLSILGYYTPTRSNPLITLGNLAGGMAMLALFWWLMQREADPAAIASPALQKLRPLAWLTLALVSLQIILGGWASANYAPGSCPNLLSCSESWASLDNISTAYNPARHIELDGSGRVRRQADLGIMSMGHRLFAIVTACWLAWLVRGLRQHPVLQDTARSLSAFSLGLIAAGISMIWWSWPLWLTTLHNSLAAGLLLGAVNLLHHVTPQPAGSPPPG